MEKARLDQIRGLVGTTVTNAALSADETGIEIEFSTKSPVTRLSIPVTSFGPNETFTIPLPMAEAKANWDAVRTTATSAGEQDRDNHAPKI